jgi:hypothetical protein
VTLHFIHIGKTAGTVIRETIRQRGPKESRYGPFHWPPHRYTLRRVPDNDWAFFCIRDPVARVVSAFESRLRKGRPRYDVEWSDAEERVFNRWPSPNAIGVAMAEGDPAASDALRSIQHALPLRHWLGGRNLLSRSNIAYIARQETLDNEWTVMREALGLPGHLELIDDPVEAHRAPKPHESLEPIALAALRGFLSDDYKIVSVCEEIRKERGWGVARPIGPVSTHISNSPLA